MTQNNPKIQGKFYPLQHEECLRAYRELNSAELDVLFYLKTIDPNCERTISCSVIASDLKKNESIVSRAVQALKEKNRLSESIESQSAEQNNTVTSQEVEY